jgi:predicted RNase H-like HicB family nuclease
MLRHMKFRLAWTSAEATQMGDALNTVAIDEYKVVLYRNQPSGWVAEIPAIPGCYALMETREEALAELGGVFQMIVEEYREAGRALPKDTTEIVHA